MPGKKIIFTATYGGITAIADFIIKSVFDPLSAKLLYGFGTVTDKTQTNYAHKSTAEILTTCSDDYKLYDGLGQGVAQ